MNTYKKPNKIYRLALYGLSGSGKTCVLAALATPRCPHPLSYTCIWQPIEMSASFDDEVDIQKKHFIKTMLRSQEWMEKAINKLSEQEVPPPNPTSNEHFIFHYDFTAPTHQTFRIELVDYSGTLLSLSGNDNTFAKSLRQKFAQMDGILVLAEAPFRDKLEQVQNSQKGCGEHAPLNLYPLQKAFSLLRCEKQECAALSVPVALLITKWDRYSNNIDYTNPANEQSKLEEFLNSSSPPPHKGLSDVLRFSVSEGNFQVFPVSALGMSECVPFDNGNVVERPKQILPLLSYGLEDAFVWLVGRRDAIDLQQFKEQSTKNIRACQQTGLELLNRFSKSSEQAKQINTILQKCQKAQKNRTLYTFITIIVLLFFAETTVDLMNYQNHVVAANNSHATHEQLEKAETWFTKYLAAPYFRHFFSRIVLSRKKAHTILTKLQKHREKFLWEPVEKALDKNFLQAAKAHAQKYLEYYPYGQHTQEAQDIKLSAEVKENEEAFHRLKFLVPEYQQDIDGSKSLLEELGKLPVHPQVETQVLRQERFALEKQLLNLLSSQQKWERFSEDIEQKMRTGEFLEAAKLLDSYQADDDKHLNDLKDRFKTTVIQDLERRVTHALKTNETLGGVVKLLTEYNSAKFPSELQTNEGKRKVTELQREIDKALYDAAKKHRDEDHIRKYLQQAPVQAMKTEVSQYQTYLEKTKPTTALNELKLKLTHIHWKYVKENDNNTVIIDFKVPSNDEQFIMKKKVKAESHTKTEINGISKVFMAKPYDPIRILVTVVNKGIFSDDDIGHGDTKEEEEDLKIFQLANGYRLPLHTHDNDKNETTGTAYLEIEGYPKKPVLPNWHREK